MDPATQEPACFMHWRPTSMRCELFPHNPDPTDQTEAIELAMSRYRARLDVCRQAVTACMRT
jgi:hypothetical protein